MSKKTPINFNEAVGKSQLARYYGYNPRTFMNHLTRMGELMAQLYDLGYTKHDRTFTPAQVKLIRQYYE